VNLEPNPKFDDLVDHTDGDRLRDAAAYFIDVARRSARMRLDAGDHPADAVAAALTMLETWVAVMDRDAAALPGSSATRVQAVLERLSGRIGVKAMWNWVRRPHPSLDGTTPLAAIAAHRLSMVERLIAESGDDALRGRSR
jgi:hypothetical protein